MERIIVKPDVNTVIYTATTEYNFVASGNTQLTQTSGNPSTVTIYAPTGGTATWGLIAGDINNQSDLIAVLNSKSDTGHTHSQYLTGVTWNDVGNKPNLVETSTYNAHTGDSTIHYAQGSISITQSQVQGLTTVLNTKSDTGHTHSQYLTGVTWNDVGNKPNLVETSTYNSHVNDNDIHYAQSAITITQSQISDLNIFTGNTFTGSGSTSITKTGDNINIYSPVVDTSSFINNAKFNAHTGDTGIHFTQGSISISQSQVQGLTTALNTKSNTGHTHSQYLTGVSWNDVQSKPNLVLESTYNAHTGDSTIHYAQGSISINQSQVQGLTTALNAKSDTGHTHSQYSTGYTFTASGGTVISENNNNITIYSPTGGTSGGGTWGSITGTLSNQTDLNNALTAKTDKNIGIKTITTSSYTVIASDNNKVLLMNGSTNHLITLPSGLPSGFHCSILNETDYEVNFQQGSGTQLRSINNYNAIVDKYGQASMFNDNNIWRLYGDLGLSSGPPPPDGGDGGLP